MAKGLTEKQRRILEHLIDFQKENGFPPTIREIGETFAIGSLRGVTVHLDALVKKGFISRGRTSRSIRITAPDPRDPQQQNPREPALRLPLLTDIPRGAPPAEALTEVYVTIPDELAAPATPTGFLIRIGASGVHGEPIVPGDLIVIRPQDAATRGDLVAARVNGHVNIMRATGEEAEIAGRVVGLIRRY